MGTHAEFVNCLVCFVVRISTTLPVVCRCLPVTRKVAVSDEEAVKVLRKMSKMRQESIEMFEKGGEPERAAAEKAELDVIAQWLPALASEDTVRGWIQSLIDEGNTNPGKLMGMLMKDHKDELDGKMARELCNEMCG